MSTLRVVHVSLGTQVGGMEKLLVEFARLTDPQRFGLTFVSLEKSGPVAEEIKSLGYPVMTMNKTPGLKPGLVVRLAKILRTLRPHVVHTHNTAGYLYGVSAAVMARVPRIIHTRHGRRLHASARGQFAFRGLAKFVDCVVSVSEDTHRLTLQKGIREPKAVVIRNGVDLGRFPLRTMHTCTGSRCGRLVVVARLSPEKDIATLLRAFSIVLESMPEWTLDIVGDGPERAALETLASSLKIEAFVRFHGQRQDVATVLSDASIFVLPSLTEGISLTLLEAMATGLPVVACRVGGNPEVVVDGGTGVLVPPGDPRSMADAIGQLQTDTDRAQQMGDAGRKRVEDVFCIGRMIREYENLYEMGVGGDS